MDPYLAFSLSLLVLAALVIVLDKQFAMLRDAGTTAPRPYSFARVQLAWWTVLVLSAFISIFIVRHSAPTFDSSTLYLLGIASATTIGATLIDVSDQNNPNVTSMAQNMPSDNFWLDILSDKNGVDIHRFQTVVFNLVFGVWFIIEVFTNLPQTKIDINHIIPVISGNNLILLGVSAGTYAALKTTENTQQTAAPAPAAQPVAQPAAQPVVQQAAQPAAQAPAQKPQ